MISDNLEAGPPSDLQEGGPRRSTAWVNVVAGAVTMGLASAFLLGALHLGVRVQTVGMGPKDWPTVLGICGIVLGALLVVQGVRGARDEDVTTFGRDGAVKVAITLAAVSVVIAAWSLGLTYLVWVPALCVGLSLLYGARRWRGILILTAVVTAILFFVFDLLLKVAL